jgi:hypothetical protein
MISVKDLYNLSVSDKLTRSCEEEPEKSNKGRGKQMLKKISCKILKRISLTVQKLSQHHRKTKK